MSPLKVYKASAGSGKTFRLTYEYLRLLFKDPLNYKYILAVTFTNKAASEMKSRILERLYDISTLEEGEPSGDVDLLINDSGLPRREIILRSRQLLVRILNDYSMFSVGTIDRFFQGVIRAFAREIGLQAGFSLELDRDRILSEAVDRMFIDISEDKEIRQWLLSFAESRIENDKGWNFRADIINLAKDLFLESYQSLVMESDIVVDRKLISNFMTELKTIIKDEESRIREIAVAAMTKISDAGFDPVSFVQKSRGIPVFFENIINGGKYFLTPGQQKAITDLSKWVPEKDFGTPKADLSEKVLQPLLSEIFERGLLIRSAQSISPYMYTLGILNDLTTKILDITSEKNLFLLNDSSRFLKGLIGDNPTPFIYEKTGNSFHHIMLDEFQDTSVFQWENFKPLIAHTLAFDNENLIVGDVKQSIYRWRNSDWKILARGVDSAFPGQNTETMSLTENWRSRENIIRFNNSMFSSIPGIIQSIITSEMDTPGVSDEFRKRWSNLLEMAYSDVIQDVPDKATGTAGYVKGRNFEGEKSAFRESAMEAIPQWIMELQDKGYKAGDIAILTRNNSEGANIAQSLMDYDRESNNTGQYSFDFVSNESLFLDKNVSVRFILSVLSFLDNSDDPLNLLHVKYYYILISGADTSNLHEALDPSSSVKDLLPKDFIQSIPKTSRLPLFELIEQVISSFSLDKQKSDLPYLQAFQNIVIDIQREEQGNVHDFLEYWKEFGSRKSLNVSDGQDAIQIMTIHKAKGLQFKAVLIPFCNWELTTDARRDNILWCNTRDTIFSSIPVVPIKYKSDLKGTIFAEDYLEEMIMGYVDSINLLYVALTRAEESLYIGMPEFKPGQKLTCSGDMLMHALASGNKIREHMIDLRDTQTISGFELGEIAIRESGEKVDLRWALEDYPVNIRGERLRLKLKSKDFFLKNDEMMDDHINFGNLMHDIFSLVKSASDIEMAVEKYRSLGLIKSEQAQQLKALIRKKIEGEGVNGWFDPDVEVMNERSILVPGYGEFRPDRVCIKGSDTVVVDYKFGLLEERKHEKQVSTYMKLMNDMGYPGVKGYIWYVMKDKVVKVD